MSKESMEEAVKTAQEMDRKMTNTNTAKEPRIGHVNGDHLWYGKDRGYGAALRDCPKDNKDNYAVAVVKLADYEAIKSELTTLTEENAVLKSRTNDLQSRTEELTEAAQGLVEALENIISLAKKGAKSFSDDIYIEDAKKALTTWK